MSFILQAVRNIADDNVATRCETALAREFDSVDAFEAYMHNTPRGVATARLAKIRSIGAKCIFAIHQACPREDAPKS